MLIKYNNYLVFINKDYQDSFVFETIHNYDFTSNLNLIFYNYIEYYLCFYYYNDDKQIFISFETHNRNWITLGIYGKIEARNIFTFYNKKFKKTIDRFLKYVN